MAIKTKLKLNKTQEILMTKYAGILRFTYNLRAIAHLQKRDEKFFLKTLDK
ncbi:helix-turn-helix domain-containing protein [Anabaena sp. FACHB-1237]|uniref:helix-turn-helix domain-containing protein n=1 Tax=Anabaena sp. FACHB-1237 TaxID=2692769 RepID=UPI001F5563DE|nr:helix-turn-helix domain-containing protein [Anabaena sp. FACHB-1237]